MGIGAVAAGALLLVGPVLNLLPPANGGNHREIGLSVALVLVWLLVAIARLARHRFTSKDDQDPLMGEGTRRAQSLQNQLQNTLEQCVLALGAYAVWWMCAPAQWGALPLVAAILFSLGRLLFFAGYELGAAKRALGFALTFYPTIGVFCAGVFELVVMA